ncbi:alpha-L-fucosidase [Fictibacillus sp. Mic-4]|uniref:alpha-L-fucosidase n=1 Tax=Fictibacillus sp. Mic-4 TaxID=3132826 RepID=UPI003CF27FD3
MVEMIRSFQPDMIIDNRLGGNIIAVNPEIYAGNVYSPEQIVPPEDILKEKGEQVPWEACITLNNHWGYHTHGKNYKSSKQVIRALVECVSKYGNLLLNVGPNAKGEIPKELLEILEAVGKWMKNNGESIYGYSSANLPKPEWGCNTQKGNFLYAHVYDPETGPINFSGLKARLLADGSELHVQTPWTAEQYSDIASGGHQLARRTAA